MRAALDAGPLLDPETGIGRYTREIARELMLLGVDVRKYAVAWGGSAPVDVNRWRIPARVARAMWKRFDAPPITRLVGNVDIVHGTNFVLPALGRARGIVTIHDLSFFRDDAFPGSEALRELVPWSLDRATAAICPTRAIADEVAGRFGFPRERIGVTFEGVSPVFFGASRLAETALGKMGIPGRFILAVGTIEPRKNLPRLLDAWKIAQRKLRDHTLVLAGPKGWGPDLPATERVILTGWVGDETLPGLMAAADVFCYPSLYEGFGLPPLEAMAAGTAVVACRYSAAPEVLGEAALLVEPTDVESLANALIAAATDENVRRRLALAGRARAGGFSWDRTARATLKLYEDVVMNA